MIPRNCLDCGIPITKMSDSGKCRFCSQRKTPFKRLFNKLVANAKRRGVAVELTLDEFTLYAGCPGCHYCGRKLRWAMFGKKATSYNLDRMDNNSSYSVENCVPCCFSCNDMKSNRFSYTEFSKFKDLLEEIRRSRDDSNECAGGSCPIR